MVILLAPKLQQGQGQRRPGDDGRKGAPDAARRGLDMPGPARVVERTPRN